MITLKEIFVAPLGKDVCNLLIKCDKSLKKILKTKTRK